MSATLLENYDRGKRLFERFLPLSNQICLLQAIVQNPQHIDKQSLAEWNETASRLQAEFQCLVDDVNKYVEDVG